MTHAAATKAFIPQQGGKVISVTLSPHNGMPGMVHSGAARAAVENMMRTLSIEWARFGIKLCALAAGQFDTEVFRTKYPQVVVEGAARSVPAQRLGRPEEMAWLVAYLASPAGDFFSGTTITIDGARDNWFGPWPPPGLGGESGEPPAEERASPPRRTSAFAVPAPRLPAEAAVAGDRRWPPSIVQSCASARRLVGSSSVPLKSSTGTSSLRRSRRSPVEALIGPPPLWVAVIPGKTFASSACCPSLADLRSRLRGRGGPPLAPPADRRRAPGRCR